jgi:hypothetical protein
VIAVGRERSFVGEAKGAVDGDPAMLTSTRLEPANPLRAETRPFDR